ncbi:MULTISPECIES: hypothetical protein [unclassified Streptomyces]|uniref:hypothetical protein n=1 Tax=unclassified Streptomyces TaxID=2593676 RepID=UPI00081E9698|nr:MULTISPECIES: hypothetical protein [unclassified Streptomyces]MYZ37356.1 hypothetical protein [Streptomyces sp. SID4917]SCF90719.1 hypothetical protein GA0115259_104637 [Streptomyces sp. MnatMP-M17]
MTFMKSGSRGAVSLLLAAALSGLAFTTVSATSETVRPAAQWSASAADALPGDSDWGVTPLNTQDVAGDSDWG